VDEMSTLGELIVELEKHDPELVVPHGFNDPHSYRGYYEDLEFTPAVNITIGAMLEAATSALGATFEGWKGGDYTMRTHTAVWVGQEGEHGGETIGPLLLKYMLASARPVEEASDD